MAYHEDGPLQLSRIQSNLAGCRQTETQERSLLQEAIVKACAGKAHQAVDVSDISNVKSALWQRASTDRLLLCGSRKPDLTGTTLLHTKTEAHFMNDCSLNLQHQFKLDPGQAEDVAQELLTELASKLSLAEARRVYAGLGLQRSNSPLIWLADPVSAAPPHDDNLGLLPARLGIRPGHDRYLLFKIAATECRTARFADSGGYEYWLPGGSTAPIEDCPPGYSGLEECVALPLTLWAIRSPVVRFVRAV